MAQVFIQMTTLYNFLSINSSLHGSPTGNPIPQPTHQDVYVQQHL
jgi:hypothetical protein